MKITPPFLGIDTETEEGTSDNSGSEQNGESLWLDIGKNFVESKQISRNTDGELECEAVGSPPPKVYWMKDGVPIESVSGVGSTTTKTKCQYSEKWKLYKKFPVL